MSHDQKHEEILRALAVGDLGPDSREVLELLAACAPCRASWDELRRVHERLAREDAERRAILADAQSNRTDPAEERVERALRAEIARTRSGDPHGARDLRRARARWPARILAAAALVFVLGWVYRAALQREPHEANDVVLGTQIEDLQPVGTVASYSGIVFTWSMELSPEGWFALRLEGRNATTEAWQPLVGPPARLRANRFEPESSITDRWPDQLRWRVIAYDVGGNVLGDSAWQSLSRVP